MSNRRQAIVLVVCAALVTAGIMLAVGAAPGLTGKAGADPTTSPSPSPSPVLQIARNGHVMASYTLDQIEAFTAVSTNAGYRGGSAHGPDAVTGSAITDILTAVLGMPLTAAESLQVAETPISPSGYTQTFPGAQIIDPKDNYSMVDATGTPIPSTSLTGTIAAVLVYSDPDGNVMPVASGPLRFFVSDSALSDGAFTVGKNSVSSVNLLNVIDSIKISVKPKPYVVTLGKSCAFRGVVTNPVANDTKVSLRLVKNGKFTLKGAGKISSAGAYRIVYKPTKVGKLRFVVTYRAGKTFFSRVVTITVRK
jgi:hypothetical protein